MSDTPRCDEQITVQQFGLDQVRTVPADFARTLERELTEARTQLAKREAERKRLERDADNWKWLRAAILATEPDGVIADSIAAEGQNSYTRHPFSRIVRKNQPKDAT